jgi:P27 family predicted phage terminase small subunit
MILFHPTVNGSARTNRAVFRLCAPSKRTKLPRCPVSLDGEARRAWVRLTRQLAAQDKLATVSLDALAIYCQAWGRWVLAEENLRKYGPVLLSKDQQRPVASPYLTVAKQAIEQMRPLLAQLGLMFSERRRP